MTTLLCSLAPWAEVFCVSDCSAQGAKLQVFGEAIQAQLHACTDLTS